MSISNFSNESCLINVSIGTKAFTDGKNLILGFESMINTHG